jgi:uncharacterized protein (DUF302 family)
MNQNPLSKGAKLTSHAHNNRFFSDLPHSDWYKKYTGQDDVPRMHVYTIGNPLIAQTLLKHDLLAGLYVPPRIAIIAKGVESSAGTDVVYDLPSALITAGDSGEALRLAAEGLDRKLESLVREVTAQ